MNLHSLARSFRAGLPRQFSTPFCLPAFVSVLLLLGVGSLQAQTILRPIPFTLPSRDTTTSTLLPQLPTELAGSHGKLHLDTLGHIRAQDGTRLRFFGTSLCITAEFLTGSDAHLVAKRLRKLGFNAVKFVYNDNYGYDDASFFKHNDSTGKASPSSYLVNTSQLAKFDTLLYELKKNGIYAFLMLNSYHHYATGEGVQYPDSCYSNSFLFEYFDQSVAALQRKWARTLLGHVSPLSGLRLADDPQLAVLEFDQEHSLYYYWTLDRLNYIDEANKLSKGKQTVTYLQSHALDTAYTIFLRNKYGNDASVQRGWIGSGAVSPQNLFDNGSFENPASLAWTFSSRDGSSAFKVDADGGIDSLVYEKIHVKTLGAAMSAGSITMTNLSARLGFDSLYELTLWAKMGFDVTRPAFISRNILLNLYAYSSGYPRSLQVTQKIDTSWRKYTFVFRCQVGGLQYLQIQMGAELGDVWLDAFDLHHKAETGLGSGESLTSYTVQRLLYHGLGLAPIQRIRDQVQFLDSLEHSFFLSMDRVIKDSMQFKGLVNYSQNSYWYQSPDIYRASNGDVAEFHTGWDYLSSRPGQGYTDSTWMVRNTSMLRNKYGGALPSIAANSRTGKAFVLGEYTMPWPNQYLSEQMLLLPAYAAFQDWDGLFITPYAYYRDDLFADSLRNPFKVSTNVASIASNPAILALAPAASKLFREALVQPSGVMTNLLHNADDIWLAPTYASRGTYWVDGGLDNNVVTAIGVRQHFIDTVHKVAAQYPYLPDTATKHNDTGELTWDQTNGLFTIDAPTVNGGSGFFGADTLKLSALSLSRRDNGRDILSFYLLSLDSLRINASQHSLLTMVTRAQNSGLHWPDSLGFGRNWGTAPTVISAAKVDFILHTKYDSTLVYPMDPRGVRSALPIRASRLTDSTSTFEIDQVTTPSVWFDIEQKNAKADVQGGSVAGGFVLSVSTNPVHDHSTIRLTSPRNTTATLALYDDLGRLLFVIHSGDVPRGSTHFELNARDLPSGHYFLRATTPQSILVANVCVVK